MKLYPFHNVVPRAIELIGLGATVYQQFNCAKCGAKQTMDDANKFFTRGICEECGSETNIEKDGCNYMVVYSDRRTK